jgi:hypothetical protein
VSIAKSSKLYLIVQDYSSTAPDKAAPVWKDAVLEGNGQRVPLSSLKPIDAGSLRTGSTDNSSVAVKLTSVVVYDIANKGFSHFRATPDFEQMKLAQGETVKAGFFVFDRQPDLDRLVPPQPGTPLAEPPVLGTTSAAEDWVFEYALGRKPTDQERKIANSALTSGPQTDKVSAEGLADLLWAVLMKPEFQLIY